MKYFKMRRKAFFLIYTLFLGLFLVFENSCSKSDDSDEAQNSSVVTDADGNIYQTITIGDKVWMAENLRTTKYNDGTPIPLVTDDNEWFTNNTPAYCYYNNDKDNTGITYGALYNVYAITSEKFCPVGWHIPTDEEWTALTEYLGGIGVAGGKLKETGIVHWITPNTGATNQTGFSAIPGGYRSCVDGTFSYLGNNGFWWTATYRGGTSYWFRRMDFDNVAVYAGSGNYHFGFAVRCVKD